jgi:type III pantothenate kinase
VTPDVVVDIGNTRMKWGRCEGNRVVEMVSLPHDAPVEWKRQSLEWRFDAPTRWAVASVAPAVTQRFCEWLANHQFPVARISNDLFVDERIKLETCVDNRALIGIDRLLACVAVSTRMPLNVHASAVVISVGTAMTVDFIDSASTHLGGAILPGPGLMARSLHDYTAKLPHILIDARVPTKAQGTNTEDAIQVGIANAILGAADRLVSSWAARAESPPWVFATGGDVGYFRGFVFTAKVGAFSIDPMLTLEGIRIAAEALK